MVLLGWTQRDRVLAARNDFSQLYAGGMLAGSGRLYNEQANLEAFRDTVGVSMEGVLYSRPPFYAAILKPLTLLPYIPAFWVFASLNLIAAIWFVVKFRPISPELPIFAAFSLPLLASILNGQHTPLLLAIAGGGLLLSRSGRDREAGLLWSLLAIKFHLFLLLPVLLIVYRKWRVLQGGVVGGAVLALLSFAMEGASWVKEYAVLLMGSRLNPCTDCMPNLKGMANGSVPIEVGATILTVALLVYILWRCPKFEIAFAAMIVAGLLLSQHAYIQDATILLLAFALFAGFSTFKPLRGLMALALTPPLYLLLLAKAPYSAPVAAIYLVVLGLAALSVQKSSASDLRT